MRFPTNNKKISEKVALILWFPLKIFWDPQVFLIPRQVLRDRISLASPEAVLIFTVLHVAWLPFL